MRKYLVWTELKNHVHTDRVLKYTVELNDMFMMQSFMNFDFRQKLNFI